jgi:hypothetical protein
MKFERRRHQSNHPIHGPPKSDLSASYQPLPMVQSGVRVLALWLALPPG